MWLKYTRWAESQPSTARKHMRKCKKRRSLYISGGVARLEHGCALSKIWVVSDAYLLRNDSTGEIALTDRDSHTNFNKKGQLLMLVVFVTFTIGQTSQLPSTFRNENLANWNQYFEVFNQPRFASGPGCNTTRLKTKCFVLLAFRRLSKGVLGCVHKCWLYQLERCCWWEVWWFFDTWAFWCRLQTVTYYIILFHKLHILFCDLLLVHWGLGIICCGF